MPYNLLLLPLLGGFLFLRWWNPTRYHALRAEKERLLILAAIPGLASLIFAFAIVKGLGWAFPCADWPNTPCLPGWWKANVPFDYSGTSLFAFILAATLWKPLNWVCKREKAIDRVIDEDKVAFEVLLKRAQSEAKTVSVTMSNSKVYVGFVTHTVNPAFPTRFIQLLPTKSGHRDEVNKHLEFTTFYSDALDQIEKDFDEKYREHMAVEKRLETASTEQEKKALEAEHERLEGELGEIAWVADDFGIVLPVAEIMSINIFSEYVHSRYFAPPENENEEQVDQASAEPSDQQKMNYLRNLSEQERMEMYRQIIEAGTSGIEPDIFRELSSKPKTKD